MLKVVVIDDEPPARRAILRLIADHSGLVPVGEAGSVRDAVRLIQATKPDAAFLDIEMAGQNGFSLLQSLTTAPKIVVVTAYSAHAVQAFDVAAVDFLLKPVLPSRFAESVSRLEVACAPAAIRPATAPRLHLPSHRGLRLVGTERIAGLQAERDYTQVLVMDEPPLLVSRPLGQLDAELPKPPFKRLNRSLVLNLDCVLELRTISRERTDVLLAGAGVPLSLGRNASTLLRQHLAGQP